MKRALWLCLLLLASPVWASNTGKLMIVKPNIVNSNCTDDADICAGYAIIDRVERMTRQVCDLLGVNYRVVTADRLRTWDVKHATLPHGYPGAIQNEEQFDAVMMLTNFAPISSLSTNAHQILVSQTGALRADSVLSTAYLAAKAADSQAGLKKPVGWLIHGGFEKMNNTLPYFGANSCSTGVNSTTPIALPIGPVLRSTSRPTAGFYTGGQWVGTVPKLFRIPKGGLRQLINGSSAAFPSYNECNNVLPAWSDSMSTYAANDTMIAWETDWSSLSTLTGSARSFCVVVGGQGGSDDSLLGLTIPAETDVQMILYAIGHLDSLAGKVLIDKNLLPIKKAVTVDAAFCRTSSLAGPGIRPSDSTYAKASIDSIAAANARGGVQIKLTVGVNADSMADLFEAGSGFSAYVPELAWWRRLGGNVRFSPQNWRGTYKLTTPTAGDGKASNANCVDMWGFRRARAIIGDGSYGQGAGDGTDADTSIQANLWNSIDHMRASGVRREELSHTLLPVLDDWVPTNKLSPANFDSLIYMANGLGFTTIRADGRSFAGSVSNSHNGTLAQSMAPWGIAGTGALGYVNRPGRFKSSLGQYYLNVITHNGYPINGARKWFVLAGAESVATSFTNCISDSGYLSLPILELTRFWCGLLLPSDNNSDWSNQGPPGTPGPTGFTRSSAQSPRFYSFYAQVLDQQYANIDRERLLLHGACSKFNFADFSGAINGGVPPRLAWHVLKFAKNGMDTINDGYGGTLVDFAFPEDIRPGQ